MIRNYLLLTFISFFSLQACKNKNPRKEITYINIPSYLKGQLAYLDTVPFQLLKTVERDSAHIDSFYLKNQDIRNIVTPFLAPELEQGLFEKTYEETSFADASLNLITVTYNAVNKKVPVQRIDIYVNPEDNNIKQVYLVRQDNQPDSSLTQQLFWSNNKGCSLITVISKKDQPEKTENIKIKWND